MSVVIGGGRPQWIGAPKEQPLAQKKPDATSGRPVEGGQNASSGLPVPRLETLAKNLGHSVSICRWGAEGQQEHVGSVGLSGDNEQSTTLFSTHDPEQFLVKGEGDPAQWEVWDLSGMNVNIDLVP